MHIFIYIHTYRGVMDTHLRSPQTGEFLEHRISTTNNNLKIIINEYRTKIKNEHQAKDVHERI
jgi:hypothetical protein